jgi:hypothetical protein
VKRLLAGAGATAVAALAIPAAASVASATTALSCTTVHDHIAKTDNGHGTPAEWADLSMNRSTKICKTSTGYDITLTDKGRLRTIKGAGTPNGTGGQILNRVPGVVYGLYSLTATGGTPTGKHGDTSLSSTEYVKSLFTPGATVAGGKYAWAYQTLCGEKWLDSSVNSDGQGAAAGNITGKRCGKPTHSPTPTPSTTPTSPSGDGNGTPTAVPSGAPQTGDGSSSGGANTALMAAGGLVVALGGGTGLLMWRRRSQH